MTSFPDPIIPAAYKVQREVLENDLSRIRAMRDEHTFGELRSAFNEVCDRLEVLTSKLYEHEKTISS